MPPISLLARHYLSGSPVTTVIHHGRFTSFTPAPDPGHPLPWIAPALVDLQINGFAGIDFQSADPSPSAANLVAHALFATGVTRCLPTLITDDLSAMLGRLNGWEAARRQSAAWDRLVGGWHLEGPWLSPEPGYRGAHPAHAMRNPSPAALDTLSAHAGSAPLLLTLAPELPGAIAFIQAARHRGFHVSLGHTNASPPQLLQALDAGAIAFTHLGNACPQSLDRHDNILWRVLDLAAAHPLSVTLIPDALHVAPALFRLIHRALPSERICYVSDAMSAAAASPGTYPLGPLRLEVGADGVVRLPGTPHFAGSALRPLDGVFRAAQMRGGSWRESWDAFSVRPARLLGWDWGLHAGAPADCCLLQCETNDVAGSGSSPDGMHLRVIQAGQEVYQGFPHR